MLNIFRNTSDNSILQVWLTIQGSVATYLRCGTIVSNYIKKALLVSLTGEKVQIGEYLTKSLARRWLSRALCAPCHTLSCWKWRIHETSRYEKQLLLGCIAWTKLKDAASCYRCSVVRLCVCVSVSHDYELCENVWTDRDAVCVVDTSGPQMHMGWVHPWLELGWVEFGFWFRAELSMGPFRVTQPNPTHGSTQHTDNSGSETLWRVRSIDCVRWGLLATLCILYQEH